MNILYSFLCFKSDIEKNRVNYINYFVNCLVVIVLILMKNYVYTPSTGFLSFLMFQTVSRELVRLLDTHLFFLFFQFDLLFYVSQTIHQNFLFISFIGIRSGARNVIPIAFFTNNIHIAVFGNIKK